MRILFFYFIDTPLNFNETFYNGSIGDHWEVDQPVLTFSMTGIDYAETANVTLTPENATLDFFYVDGFGMLFSTINMKLWCTCIRLSQFNAQFDSRILW